MKTILTLLAIIFIQLSFSQGFKINDKEFFTVTMSVDPSASIKEKGLDLVVEFEYVGVIYAKVGFETFSVLQGDYKDIHGAIGLNFTSGYFEEVRYYTGFRGAKVYRGDVGSFRINLGLEAGVDYNISDNLTLGLRSTYDKRNDQEIMNWTPETKFSGFVRLGYKWYYKNKRN